MAKLNWSTTNSQVTDEIIYVSSSVAVGLYHDFFYSKAAKPIVISTASGGGGTVLTETTDYTIGGVISTVPANIASISPDVIYSTVAITNTAYHDTKLYCSYYPLGDLAEASDFKQNQLSAPPWRADEATTYSTVGTIVERGLRHYASTGKASNTNKDPLNQINSPYWFCSPGIDKLMEMAINGTVGMEMHPTLDRGGSEYTALMKIDEATIEGTAYEFYRIALDGTTVTGDADYEAALDVGGSNQSAFVDIFAPEVASSRSMIDMGEYGLVAQSDSGESDTLGEVQADRIQGHYHDFRAPTGTGASQNLGGTNNGSGSEIEDDYVKDPITDGTNGTPRTGSTTRGKQLVNGAAYIISMIPA